MPSFLKDIKEGRAADGGLLQRNGYTLLQYRKEGTTKFQEMTWDDYRRGTAEEGMEPNLEDLENAEAFWLGLDKMSDMTSEGRWELIVIVRSHSNPTQSYCIYKDFKVGSELHGYPLTLSHRNQELCTGIFEEPNNDENRDERGDIFQQYSRYKPFSTPDHDNDDNSENCAKKRRAGWWFGSTADNINEEEVCNGLCLNCGSTRLANSYEEIIFSQTHMGMKRMEPEVPENPENPENPEDPNPWI